MKNRVLGILFILCFLLLVFGSLAFYFVAASH